jgi:Uma2 family endonuclease
LAVEVLLPSDSFRNVTKKIERFLKSGVKVVWLVDPEEQTISVYRPNEQWKVFAADQQLVGDPELPGFTHRVSDFFLLPGELPVANPQA